jgi:hypothetical protein
MSEQEKEETQTATMPEDMYQPDAGLTKGELRIAEELHKIGINLEGYTTGMILLSSARVRDRESFIREALLHLSTNPYFFQTNGLQDQAVIQRLLTLANMMWTALNPQPTLATVPVAQPVQPVLPQPFVQPQPAVAPPAQAAPPTASPAYQPLPGFQGGSQQVSVGGQPTVQSQAVSIGATVATPYAGGVGSGVPAYQPQTPSGQKVQVIAENYQGQNLGPNMVPNAPMAPVAVPQVTAPPAPQQPGRF